MCGLKRVPLDKGEWVAGVTPCVGVWIETNFNCYICNESLSHPAWVCGLKQVDEITGQTVRGHTLRGCVD